MEHNSLAHTASISRLLTRFLDFISVPAECLHRGSATQEPQGTPIIWPALNIQTTAIPKSSARAGRIINPIFSVNKSYFHVFGITKTW